MDQRSKALLGVALLVVGAIVVLVFALPESVIAVSVPVPLAALAALVMAAGTLLVGTSNGTV